MSAPRSAGITVFLFLASLPGHAQDQAKTGCNGSTVEDYSPGVVPKAQQFLSTLKTLVKADNREEIGRLVRYPLAVNSAKVHRRIRSRAEFVKSYDTLFTAAIKRAIERQAPECLFANWQGVMIGSGEVWFEEQSTGEMKIKALNR